MSTTGASFGGKNKFEGAGGTPGGAGEFLVGVGMAAIGLYLLLNQVQVHTSFWRFGGMANSAGISCLPLLFGVGALFFNGKSVVGWLLAGGGLLFVLVGILANMDIYFQQTSLWNTLLMLVLIAGGLGLIFKSLRPHGPRQAD